jgi:hypothetical protein
LDLFPEFEGMLDFFEYFGRAAGAAYDDRSIAQDSSDGGLIDDDAFDSGEEDFGSAAFREARFHNDSLVGDGHLRNTALQQTDAKERRSDEEANESRNVNSTVRRHSFGFGSGWPGKRRDEQCYGKQLKNRGDGHMPQHHDPMQLGLIPDGFTRDEVLFDVAQGGSLNAETALGQRVPEGSRPRIVPIHDKQESREFRRQTLVALTGIEPVF